MSDYSTVSDWSCWRHSCCIVAEAFVGDVTETLIAEK